MGFSFKKLAKKAIKLGAKIATPMLASTPIGQAALKAQQALKSLGVNFKAAKLGKIQPASVNVAAAKIASPLAKNVHSPAKKLKRISLSYKNPRDMFRQLDYSANKARHDGLQFKSSKGSRMPQKRKKAPGTSKRLPPKGGLDLRAMSTQWKAAGKPGTWIGWIKANPIKKAS